MTDDALRILRRHRKQEFYRGEATPNHANHRTGAVAVCANCHQRWPCDAYALAADLANEHPMTDPAPDHRDALLLGMDRFSPDIYKMRPDPGGDWVRVEFVRAALAAAPSPSSEASYWRDLYQTAMATIERLAAPSPALDAPSTDAISEAYGDGLRAGLKRAEAAPSPALDVDKASYLAGWHDAMERMNAAPSPALDVEVLAWAMHLVGQHGADEPCYHDRATSLWPNGPAIAAEYARLMAERDQEEKG